MGFQTVRDGISENNSGQRREREHITSIGNNICKDLEVGKSLASLGNKHHGLSVERRGRAVEDYI